MDWLRWYHGTVTDPKWRVIAKRAGCTVADVVAVWATMLEDASANATERGELISWCAEDIAALLDIETSVVEEIREAMQGKVLDGDKLTGWAGRQPKREDGSAERARAWRERKKAENEAPSTDTEPPGSVANAAERKRTLEERRVEKSREEEISTSVISLSARDSIEDAASEIMRLANRGMIDNPLIGEFNPINIGHGSRQDVLDWLSSGVPAALAGEVVYNRAKAWKPTDRRRQIDTLKYFTNAVLEAFDRFQAASTPAPNGNHDRGSGSQAPAAEIRATGTNGKHVDDRGRVWIYE